jgi:hypothetical protein
MTEERQTPVPTMCAVTVRQIKPGTYEQFRKAWEPDPWLPKLTRALVFRNEDNPDMVLSVGFFDASLEEIDAIRDDPAVLAEEENRLRRISEFEERVVLNGIFELTDEVLPPGARE